NPRLNFGSDPALGAHTNGDGPGEAFPVHLGVNGLSATEAGLTFYGIDINEYGRGCHSNLTMRGLTALNKPILKFERPSIGTSARRSVEARSRRGDFWRVQHQRCNARRLGYC